MNNVKRRIIPPFFIPGIDFSIKNSILWCIKSSMKTKIKTNGDKTINHANIKAKLGLTDKTKHSVFYLEGGTFIKPKVELDNFSEIMRSIESSCKASIKKRLSQNHIFEPTFLMHFEICSERMKANKSSYLSFQYHFKQKDNENKSILSIKHDNELFFQEILNDIESNLQKYQIDLSQKRNFNI